ncbi:hypothetical protein [Duganella sp. LjRoot269]|uniref:hypothetical protein n=1 Tax=Duganella sp. LjRoot269 TaxID=3342305 RepID=UPI003ECC73CE
MKIASAAEIAPDASKAAPAAPAISHDKLRVSAKLVALVTPFMATSDIRYYLNGISIRPHPAGGAVICATNGHVLGAVHDRSAICEHDVILTITPATVAALKARINNGRELVLRHGRVAVMEGPTEIALQPGNPVVEGIFPAYQKVIPPAERLVPGLAGHYNTAYIALVDVAAKIACPKAGPSRSATFFSVDGKPDTSAVARLAAEPDFIAVLMPQRAADAVDDALPLWVAAARVKQAAPATAADA